MRPEDLRDETKSVLAALAMAALWRDKFPGGWLSIDDFTAVVARISPRRSRAGVSASIRRALGELKQLRDRVVVATKPSLKPSPKLGRRTKEPLRSLVRPLPLSIELWLLGEGLGYIEGSWRRQFPAARHPQMDSVAEVLAGLEETLIRRLLFHGQHDQAIARARQAATTAPTERIRVPLRLVLATALFRRGTAPDVRESLEILDDLLTHHSEPVDENDRLMLARIGISWAFCRFFAQVRAYPDGNGSGVELERIEQLMQAAEDVTADLNLSDRAQVANLRGIINRYQGDRAASAEEREEFYDRSERQFREALTIWRMAQDSFGIASAIFNLGEIRRIRYRLHGPETTEEQIRSTLLWYEASIDYGEELGGFLTWILDFLRAAECIAVLLRRWGDSFDEATRRDLVARADRYLARARTPLPDESWQGQLRASVEQEFSEVRAVFERGPRSPGRRERSEGHEATQHPLP